ncbi:hypothetical protein PINS_up023146 [Pythium insidiosum]|nr:hypothetical protein PINS_up023146 [Pythium insidiosum]
MPSIGATQVPKSSIKREVDVIPPTATLLDTIAPIDGANEDGQWSGDHTIPAELRRLRRTGQSLRAIDFDARCYEVTLDSFTTLVDAYERGFRVQALTLEFLYLLDHGSLATLESALSNPTTAIARTLKEIDILLSDDDDELVNSNSRKRWNESFA